MVIVVVAGSDSGQSTDCFGLIVEEGHGLWVIEIGVFGRDEMVMGVEVIWEGGQLWLFVVKW